MVMTKEHKKRIADLQARFATDSPPINFRPGVDPNAPQANLAELEDAPKYAMPRVKGTPAAPVDYGSGLMAENRYETPIDIRTTGGAGQEMRTTVGIGGNTISYAGGPRKLAGGRGGGGTMYPQGQTTPRGGGARRMKAGEVLMAPAEKQQQGDGVNDLGLISREKAKELGLGVNQWRELNTQILRNLGGLEEQQVQTEGLMDIARQRSSATLQEREMINQAPDVLARQRSLDAETEMAPILKKLFNRRISDLDKGKGKTSEYVDTDDILQDIYRSMGMTSLSQMRR